MKYLAAVILSICFMSVFCIAGEKPELKDVKDKESYSLGYQIGQTMKFQGVEIDPEIYASGLRDALSGSAPILSQDEIQRTVSAVHKRVLAAQQKELKEQGEKNLADAKTFMEKNKAKEGVKTLPSGLQYKVIKDGSGKMPKATDEVSVNYRGTLIDGSEFDSSYSRGKPESFHVDKVIRGWTEALQLMKEGAKWELFVPPELGYGQKKMGSIPPNSVLIFEVELVAVK